MTTPRDVGKPAYKALIVRGRMAERAARESLRRIIEEQPGPQTTAMLIAKTAVQLGIFSEVLSELEHIGEQARNWPKQAEP